MLHRQIGDIAALHQEFMHANGDCVRRWFYWKTALQIKHFLANLNGSAQRETQWRCLEAPLPSNSNRQRGISHITQPTQYGSAKRFLEVGEAAGGRSLARIATLARDVMATDTPTNIFDAMSPNHWPLFPQQNYEMHEWEARVCHPRSRLPTRVPRHRGRPNQLPAVPVASRAA